MMEARLLCLENVGTPREDFRRGWVIANGTGIAISQAQIPQMPAPLYTADGDRTHLIQELTAVLAEAPFCVAEPGYSQWFVGRIAKEMFLLLTKFGRQLHHIGKIERGYCSGQLGVQMASVIIVRTILARGVQLSQAMGKASGLDGGK